MSNKKRPLVTEVTAFYLSAKKSERTFVDKRDFHSLSYRYNGKILVEDTNDRIYSDAGSVTFISKGLSYMTEILEDTRMAVVHFKLDDDIDFRNAAVVKPENVGIRLLFEKLIRNFHVDSPRDFHCMSIFYELLAWLEDSTQRGITAKIPEKIRLAKEAIEQGYHDKEMSISTLAEKMNISTAYLRREFYRSFGVSPISFLRGVRIANANNMLESGLLSVSEIAEQCGFSSDSYFIQVFHKLVGEAPDKYRRRL